MPANSKPHAGEHCSCCIFFQTWQPQSEPDTGRVNGVCRRYPPTLPARSLVVENAETIYPAQFPEVLSGWWCGEFVPNNIR